MKITGRSLTVQKILPLLNSKQKNGRGSCKTQATAVFVLPPVKPRAAAQRLN
jgi:hypothetical protein